jgi:hypothetical protein
MKEEILNGNKLITEFMGGKWYSKRYPRNHGIRCGTLDRNWDCIIEKAKFHYSWDFLMPVVEKIEQMPFRVKMCGRRVEIWKDPNNLNEQFICMNKRLTKIESTWFCITQFITWHNNQNKDK